MESLILILIGVAIGYVLSYLIHRVDSPSTPDATQQRGGKNGEE